MDNNTDDLTDYNLDLSNNMDNNDTLENSNFNNNDNRTKQQSSSYDKRNLSKFNRRYKNDYKRRKRINHMKTIIVFVIIILLILPLVLCVALWMQVSKLQKQVDQLSTIHSQYEISDDHDAKYVYAAEKSSKEEESDVEDHHNEGTDLNTALKHTNEVSDLHADRNHTNEENSDTTNLMEDDNQKIESSIVEKGIYEGKTVYLTFDDGPSIYTNEILDILAEHNVKVTFFVVGKTDTRSKQIYNRILEEGHSLGLHSYSHDYNQIYNSLEDFDKDFTKLWKLLYDTTGYKPSLYRFPGGSDNFVNKSDMKDFIQYINDQSLVYFDWNVENGDAKNLGYTKEQLKDNILKDVAIKDRSIVLMHDTYTKKTTVESLPELLQALILGGAQILPLDKDVEPIQMIKADSVN